MPLRLMCSPARLAAVGEACAVAAESARERGNILNERGTRRRAFVGRSVPELSEDVPPPAQHLPRSLAHAGRERSSGDLHVGVAGNTRSSSTSEVWSASMRALAAVHRRRREVRLADGRGIAVAFGERLGARSRGEVALRRGRAAVEGGFAATGGGSEQRNGERRSRKAWHRFTGASRLPSEHDAGTENAAMPSTFASCSPPPSSARRGTPPRGAGSRPQLTEQTRYCSSRRGRSRPRRQSCRLLSHSRGCPGLPNFGLPPNAARNRRRLSSGAMGPHRVPEQIRCFHDVYVEGEDGPSPRFVGRQRRYRRRALHLCVSDPTPQG